MSEDSQDTVVVKINQAKNLPKADIIGTIDAYFIFKYGSVQHKTEAVPNNKNPLFNETATFNYDSSVEEITYELWDWDKNTKDDLIGTGKIKVADWRNKKQRKWFPITNEKGKKVGEIELQVTWNAPVESILTRDFGQPIGPIQQAVLDYLKSKPAIEQVINFVYTSVIWESWITYGILAVLLLGNYFVSVSTQWRTSAYLFLLAAEVYVIQFVFTKFLKYLDQPIETVEQNTNTVVNYVFSLRFEVKNPLDDVKPLEKFQQTPYYGPTVVIVGLLLLALVSGIFSGSFLAFVAIVGLLLAPGLHTKGLDVKFVNWWTPTVYTPIILPQWNKFVKPYVDQYVYGIKPEPAVPSEAPASQ